MYPCESDDKKSDAKNLKGFVKTVGKKINHDIVNLLSYFSPTAHIPQTHLPSPDEHSASDAGAAKHPHPNDHNEDISDDSDFDVGAR